MQAGTGTWDLTIPCTTSAISRWAPKVLWPEYRRQLNGKIVFILGNHDAPLARFQEMLLPEDACCTDYLYRTGSGLQISLSHIPPDHDEVQPREGRLLRSNSYPDVKPDLMFCGHVHERWRTHPATGCINVGVDVWDYEPRTLDEILTAAIAPADSESRL